MIFSKNFAKKNHLNFTEYLEDKLISTSHIPNLQVFNNEGIEILGLGCSISGMDTDGYDIYIEGIAYPFYQNEFPHHKLL